MSYSSATVPGSFPTSPPPCGARSLRGSENSIPRPRRVGSPFLARQSEEELLDVRRFVHLSDEIVRDIAERVAEESAGSTGLVTRVKSAMERLHREFEQTGAALESVAEIGLGHSE